MGVVEWVTIIGLPLAVVQLWLGRLQERRTFEQQFVDRYWAIADAVLLDPEHAEVHRRRYFRLTEDQFELMRLGQVSWSTWEVWHDGIRSGAADFDPAADGHHKWLGICVKSGDHPGHDCLAVLEADGVTRRRSRIGPLRLWQKIRRAWWRLRR